MKNKKLKSLDCIRFILSIIVLSYALYLIITPFITISLAGQESEISGLVFIFSFIGLLFAIPGVLGFIRFFITRKKDASQRRVSVLGLFTIIGLFFDLLFSPVISNILEIKFYFVVFLLAIGYLICEIIERRVVKNVAKIELSNQKTNDENTISNETIGVSSVSGKLYCSYCGKYGIDETSNYCQFCGKKIK